MKIPFHKVDITGQEIKGVIRAVKSGWWTMGPKTIEFERRFRNYVGSKHAIAVNSCTAAMHLALDAIGLKEGDEVIVPAITFTATAEVVCYFKAKPILIDIRRDTLNIDVSKIESKITSKTKAIIPVHYGGQPVDLDMIKKIAKKHNLFVIEDAAHALPAWYKNKKIGTLSDMTCFSFYVTKTLATGEGGMITTNNKRWADKMKIMRLHGMNKDAWKRYSKTGVWFYDVMEAGFKYNTTDINAALGLAQLKRLETMWRKRKRIARRYSEAFKSIDGVACPTIDDYTETSWHLYVIKLNLDSLKIGRNLFIKELGKRGISSSVHFIPLYKHTFYKNLLRIRSSQFPESEYAYKRIISLPIYPSMGQEEVDRVIWEVKDVVEKNKK
ncbi:MAG: DegT/DnrJ/EryC1/StrS family aminotransferase [Candidatus Omnitrophica bacterium]|nr:DegT/DnrJ/EryC1/StrS family aminotransferase [Candidatus Omnitrophota bacterium]